MPCDQYQSSPIGRSDFSLRRPFVYVGGCSSSSSESAISPACRRSRSRFWISTASRYGTCPGTRATQSSGAPASATELLDVPPHAAEELRRKDAVERAVVPGHAEVGHRPDRDAIPADHNGPLDDCLEVEDRHLRLVDDRRCEQGAIPAWIRDRERSAF